MVSHQLRSRGHNLREHITYFISNHHTNKGLDPNIHVIDGIYNIKGRSTLHILVANYTNATDLCQLYHHIKDDR